MDGGILSGLRLPALKRHGIWANASAVRTSEPGLESGFDIVGGEVVPCKGSIITPEASCISLVAADGVCRCGAPVSIAMDVAG